VSFKQNVAIVIYATKCVLTRLYRFSNRKSIANLSDLDNREQWPNLVFIAHNCSIAFKANTGRLDRLAHHDTKGLIKFKYPSAGSVAFQILACENTKFTFMDIRNTVTSIGVSGEK
jgi:hypothetical protein